MALHLKSSFRRLLSAPVVQKDTYRRSLWQEIIRIRTDNEGKRRHEDPERVVRRFQEQLRSDGESLVDLHFHNDKHEKACMKRQRLANKRRYDFDKKHVLDLVKYIQFVQDNAPKK